MKPIERLAWYLKLNNIKFSVVEKAAGLGRNYLGKQVRSSASIGADILEKICNAYPGINPVWLLTGKGEYNIAATGTPVTAVDHTAYEPDNRLALIEGLPITDKEKYELCRLLVQKLLLQLEIMQKKISAQPIV